MEFQPAKVRYLLPGIRRGFVVSVAPIVLLAVLSQVRDAAGGLVWAGLRLGLAAVLFWVVARLGDGLADPDRTLRVLSLVMAASSAGWGALALLVETSDLEWRAVVMFALVANLAIVTIQCAADRTVFLCSAVPVFVLGGAGLLLRGDGSLLLPGLFALALPYAVVLFSGSHRALLEGFALERRNELLIEQLAERQVVLSHTNEQLEVAAARQAVLLDERAALLSTVGHDLGSPLGAAMLTAEVLADRPDAVSPEMQRQLAGRIKFQVHEALTVLRDLTSAQRLDATAQEIRRTELDLEDLVGVIVARHRDDAHTIVNVVPERMAVSADPGLLDRMVDNLVANAVKYAVSATIEVGADRDADGFRVWVDDDGPGIAPEIRDTLFDPYVRGPAPTSTSGTGIGLHLVRTFAQSHGGEVSWEPSDRGGSRFVIHLPDPTDEAARHAVQDVRA